jgi:hypothetical protein
MKNKLEELSSQGLTPKLAAASLSIKYTTLLKRWKKLGLPLEGSGGKNRFINSNPFEKWEEWEQYWFGYIAGDGNVSSKKYSVAIYSQDLDHLQKYADWIGLKMLVYGKKGTVLFGHKDTHAWLIERGITPNKSLDLKLNVPLTPHILRGIFDSDGCGRKAGNPTKITSGSLVLLRQIQEYLTSQGISTVIHLQCERTYCIHIKRKSDPLFFSLLYSSSTVHMQRKYDRLKSAAQVKSGELREKL